MPPHYVPGSCPPSLTWCASQQSCIPAGIPCASSGPPVFPPNGYHQCYGNKTWCPTTQSCIDPAVNFCPQAPTPPVIPNGQGPHGCSSDGGYSWCESLQKCVQPWNTPCPSGGNPAQGGSGLPYVQAFPNALGQELSLPYMPVDTNVRGEFDTHISTSDFNRFNPLTGGFRTPTDVYSNAVGGQFAGFRSLF